MQFKAVQQIGIAGLACGIALCASDFWNTKEYSQWSDEELTKILTDSPWAKHAKVTFAMSDRGGSGRSAGGGGYPGGGGGGGYPGGGGGYPGGSGGGGYPGGGGGAGYPGGGGGGGGGIGLPGGGIGFPGGGMGGGGGTGRGGGGRGPVGGMPSMDVVLRWDSALPIQQALSRRPDELQADNAERKESSSTPSDNDSYVITARGLRMPDRRARGAYGNGDDQDDSDRRQGSQDPDRMRERLMDYTRLAVKGRASIVPSDVKVNTQYGRSDVRFIFPRRIPISLDDKEVTFESELGPAKIEQKFRVKDMVYKGKLAL